MISTLKRNHLVYSHNFVGRAESKLASNAVTGEEELHMKSYGLDFLEDHLVPQNVHRGPASLVERALGGFTVGVGWGGVGRGRGRVGSGSVRVIFIALLVILVLLFAPAAQLLQDFPLVALPAPLAVRVLLLPVACKKTATGRDKM